MSHWTGLHPPLFTLPARAALDHMLTGSFFWCVFLSAGFRAGEALLSDREQWAAQAEGAAPVAPWCWSPRLAVRPSACRCGSPRPGWAYRARLGREVVGDDAVGW